MLLWVSPVSPSDGKQLLRIRLLHLAHLLEGELESRGRPRYLGQRGVADWQRWNVFTGTRDDGNHYAEGGPYDRYVGIDNSISTYPRTSVHPSAGKMPQGLGANYTRFQRQAGSPDNKLVITYDALNSCSYDHVISFVRKFASQPVWEEYDVPVDANGHAAFEMTRWDETEYLYMVVPMKRACGSTGRDFVFAAATAQAAGAADPVLPTRVIRLDQNCPNPFNPLTAIDYALRDAGTVRVDVFDAAGRHVRTLVNQAQSAGEHQVRWSGEDDFGRRAPAGLYFYTLQAAGERATRKMILLE